MSDKEKDCSLVCSIFKGTGNIIKAIFEPVEEVEVKQVQQPNKDNLYSHRIVGNIGYIDNVEFNVNIGELTHGIVAGTSGWGKGVFLQHFIGSLLSNNNTDFNLTIIDPKGGLDYAIFTNIENVTILQKPKDDGKAEVFSFLSECWSKHEERLTLMLNAGVKNIAGYNKYADKNDIEKLKPILIFIDEYAILKSMDKKEVEISEDETIPKDAIDDMVSDIMAICRATGIHVMLTTQRPTADIISGDKKNNASLKISFHVDGKVSSNVVGFDNTIEEELRPHSIKEKGVCAVKIGSDDVVHVKVPFSGNDELNDERILNMIKGAN